MENINVNGSLTASYASIANSNANGSTGYASNSTNGWGNSNWQYDEAGEWAYSAVVAINTGGVTNSEVNDFPLLKAV